MPPKPPPVDPAELAAVLARIEERLDALEGSVGKEATKVAELAEKDHVRSDDLAKVAWAVKHGRKRPW